MYPSHETLERLARQRRALEEETRRAQVAITQALREEKRAAVTEEKKRAAEENSLPKPVAPWADKELLELLEPIRRRNRTTPRTRAIHRCADALERIADALGPKKPRVYPGCELCDRYPNAGNPTQSEASQCPVCSRWIDPFHFART